MAFIVFGQKKTTIGIDEVLVRCPSCEKSSWADIQVDSLYFHFYWIPVFPYEKSVHIICNECGLKRYDLAFNANFIPTYPEIKHRFKHPLRTYSLTLIVGSVIILAILT